jgi:hypothetical protein
VPEKWPSLGEGLLRKTVSLSSIDSVVGEVADSDVDVASSLVVEVLSEDRVLPVEAE